MKKIIFLFLLSLLISKDLLLEKHTQNDNNRQNSYLKNNDSSRPDITLFEWDFEGIDLWNADDGWELTEQSYNSETHSYLSPNTANTYNDTWNLTSPVVTLPQIGDGEIMRFKFWLWGDTPDTEGDGDGYLDDYYQLSIMDLEALSWHASENAPGAEGSAYWCADEAIGPNGGYLDEWMQYLDTPAITLGDNAMLSADLKWALESPAGAVVAGSCTDGWDAANVRISNDGGTTWALLEDPNLPYHFDCGYGWIYNDG